MRFHRTFTLTIAAATLLASGAETRAGFVLYDNLLTADPYDWQGGWLVAGASIQFGPFVRSESFVATAGGALDRILLPIVFAPSRGVGSPVFDLALKDAANNVLESWSGLVAPTEHPVDDIVSILTVSSIVHPLLQSGASYTLTAAPGNDLTRVAWESDTNTLIEEKSGFRLLSDHASGGGSAVPEPSSLLLLGMGLLSVGGFSRWRRNAAAVCGSIEQ